MSACHQRGRGVLVRLWKMSTRSAAARDVQRGAPVRVGLPSIGPRAQQGADDARVAGLGREQQRTPTEAVDSLRRRTTRQQQLH